MPWVIPTPDELAAMSWHARQQSQARMREIRSVVDRRRALALLPVADQARVLLDELPVDPDADAHWLALEEVTR